MGFAHSFPLSGAGADDRGKKTGVQVAETKLDTNLLQPLEHDAVQSGSQRLVVFLKVTR